MQLTMIGDTAAVASCHAPLAAGYTLRPVDQNDSDQLAELFFSIYSGSVVEELALAVEEIRMTFAGDFGELLVDLSPVALYNGRIVSAVMTVKQAPWENTPDGLFVIEVFTDPQHRRKGLARAGLTRMAADATAQGFKTVGLRVECENDSAMALYRSLGFTKWELLL